jgi:hypothetical protein
MSWRPASMTTKFAPQMIATTTAASAWRGVMASMLAPSTVKHQRIMMDLTM